MTIRKPERPDVTREREFVFEDALVPGIFKYPSINAYPLFRIPDTAAARSALFHTPAKFFFCHMPPMDIPATTSGMIIGT